MKAKITAKSNNELTLICPANDYEVGQEVIVDTDDIGKLRRAFHPLLHEWIDSGYCPF